MFFMGNILCFGFMMLVMFIVSFYMVMWMSLLLGMYVLGVLFFLLLVVVGIVCLLELLFKK